MQLADQQAKFTSYFIQLISYINNQPNYRAVIAEVLRTQEQQDLYIKEGKSKTHDSKHLLKLAGDILIFKKINNIWIYTAIKDDYKFAADYWKTLDTLNVAGYDWGWDANHFQYTK
jgi:hypothetical protein